MKAILIPVKNFREAKKRLTPHFSPSDRAALAEAMLSDFFEVVATVREIDRVFVISSEPIALERARALGWETISEVEQRSESSSVDAASRYCAEHGVKALLRLPVDIPLVQASDIETIFTKLRASRAAVLVPSRDGTGTNALLREPPTLFPSHFGPNSFEKHLAEAGRCSAHVQVLRNPRLELDVDELEDFLELRGKLSPSSATNRWMLHHGLGVAEHCAAASAVESAASRPIDAGPESADQ
ncbi:MAG: 2-phospho-L-lactate guanylyltransferase [Candidatus Acidiferrales bacterium]